MKRTQIYLPEGLHSRLSLKSANDKVSIAHIIRELLNKHLDDDSEDAGLLELASANIKGGPADLSTNMKQYLYGGK